jgi:hypothetical protein
MKDNVNDEVPNGNPKILILSNGVLNLDEVTKSGGKNLKNYNTFNEQVRNHMV